MFALPNLSLTALALALALSAGCGYVCRGPDACPRLEDDDPQSLALERAARYLGRKPLTGRQAWFARQGGLELGGEFTAWKDRLVVIERGATPIDQQLSRQLDALGPLPSPLSLPRVSVPDEVARNISAKQLNAGWEAMFLAAKCAELGADDARTLRNLLLDRTGSSYLLVAQLWALVTAHHRACAAAFDFDELRPAFAERLYAELLADPGMHELTVERMGALCYAGLCDWIPADYTDRLIAAQHPVGAWLDPHFDGGPSARPSALQMSAVAFYVLAQLEQPAPEGA